MNIYQELDKRERQELTRAREVIQELADCLMPDLLDKAARYITAPGNRYQCTQLGILARRARITLEMAKPWLK